MLSFKFCSLIVLYFHNLSPRTVLLSKKIHEYKPNLFHWVTNLISIHISRFSPSWHTFFFQSEEICFQTIILKLYTYWLFWINFFYFKQKPDIGPICKWVDTSSVMMEISKQFGSFTTTYICKPELVIFPSIGNESIIFFVADYLYKYLYTF